MTINIRKILFFDEFLQSCRAIKREKWRYLFLFFQFFAFADLWKYCFSDTFLVVNCVLCAVCAIRHGVEWRKVIAVMAIYAVMMVYPIGIYGLNEMQFRQYVGYGIRILTGCFIASYFRHDLVSKFENLMFVLAYISIPLFVLQVINPNIYNFLTPLTRALIGFVEYKENSHTYVHQYMIVYYKHIMAENRNCGFMWEPGAFAMMLTWAILFLLYLNRFQWHRRMIVYVIAMLSTFSLMGYSSLFALLIIYLAQNNDFKKIGYTIVGGGLLWLVFSQTYLFQEQQLMMTNKAERYANESERQLYRGRESLTSANTTKRVGRIAQFYILGDIIREDPLGRGMSPFKYESANGIVNLIVKWGVWALLILAISTYYFIKDLEYLSRLRLHWYIILMSMVVFIMPTISNPIYNRVFFMVLLTFPLFAKRQI